MGVVNTFIVMLLPAFLFASCSNSDSRGEDNSSYTAPQHDTLTTRQDRIDGRPGETPVANWLIVPGERAGRTALGTDASTLEQLLGKPDFADAAMGKAWLTWYGRKDEHNNRTELNIYTAYKDSNMRERTVQMIRVTSSYFHTGNGVRVYASLQEVRNAFPSLHGVAQYNNDGRTVVVYDESLQGIAFEFVSAGEQSICTGIIIHSKGKELVGPYGYFRPGMRLNGPDAGQ